MHAHNTHSYMIHRRTYVHKHCQQSICKIDNNKKNIQYTIQSHSTHNTIPQQNPHAKAVHLLQSEYSNFICTKYAYTSLYYSINFCA